MAEFPPTETQKKRIMKNPFTFYSAGLNYIEVSESTSDKKNWRILFYNDLSICYAGLSNTSISRGYAEEARNIIENEKAIKNLTRSSVLKNQVK